MSDVGELLGKIISKYNAVTPERREKIELIVRYMVLADANIDELEALLVAHLEAGL